MEFPSCNVNRCTSNAGENAEVINAHSEAIEALMDAVTVPGGCLVHQSPRMTADDAAAIVVVEFMRATTGDVHTDAWLRRIRGRIISALREHGREDR